MRTSSEHNRRSRARLVLVVGPSGAGKDALMEGAKLAFARDERLIFARRIVTRIAVAEDHESIEASAFEEAQRRGDYLLSWRAHGLGYALPGNLQAGTD